MATSKATLGIDFDGVIHRYSDGWQDGEIYDPPVNGAVAGLTSLAESYRLVIFTARDDLDAVWEWLGEFGIDDLFDDVTNQKPHALVYIDDRGLRFQSWAQTLDDLEEILGVSI